MAQPAHIIELPCLVSQSRVPPVRISSTKPISTLLGRFRYAGDHAYTHTMSLDLVKQRGPSGGRNHLNRTNTMMSATMMPMPAPPMGTGTPKPNPKEGKKLG